MSCVLEDGDWTTCQLQPRKRIRRWTLRLPSWPDLRLWGWGWPSWSGSWMQTSWRSTPAAGTGLSAFSTSLRPHGGHCLNNFMLTLWRHVRLYCMKNYYSSKQHLIFFLTESLHLLKMTWKLKINKRFQLITGKQWLYKLVFCFCQEVKIFFYYNPIYCRRMVTWLEKVMPEQN